MEEKEDKLIFDNNLYVSPGWIDIHTHIYHGVSDIGVKSIMCGPKTGVTVLVDAGSSGEANFIGLREYVIKPSYFPIFCFINMGSIGLVLSNQVSEIDSLEKINIDSPIDKMRRIKNILKESN